MIYFLATLILLMLMSLGVVIGVLIHRTWFGKNNPNEAWIFEKVGDSYLQHKGKLLDETNRSKLYSYNHNQFTVIVPKNSLSYPIVYWKRRRIIGVSSGNLIASPLGNAPIETDVDNATLVKNITLSHIGSEMVKAMQGFALNMGTVLVIVLVVALLIGGGIFAVNYARQSQNKPQEKPGTTQPIEQQLPPSGVVK